MSDSIFGAAGRALQLSEDRAVLLTNNLVNAATPNYKARDFDFHKVLQQAGNQAVGLETNEQPNEIPLTAVTNPTIQYRVPMQQSADGNTVDEELERKDFLDNAMQYQVNLTFVQNESAQLMKAMKGE